MRITAGINKTNSGKTERVLHKMKQTLISMDAVPGGSNGETQQSQAEPA